MTTFIVAVHNYTDISQINALSNHCDYMLQDNTKIVITAVYGVFYDQYVYWVFTGCSQFLCARGSWD